MNYVKAKGVGQRAKGKRRRAEAGFTLIELMVTMVIFVFAIAAASQVFTKLLTQFKQQTRIAETNIEGVVGLNILRQDIEHAGMGLPWNVTGIADSNGDGVINFQDNVPGYVEAGVATYNDAPNSAPSAFRSGDTAVAGGSDYLVIKSAGAAANNTAGKNTRLASAAPFVRTWGSFTDDMVNTDMVIVLSPGATAANSRSLVVVNNSYQTTYNTVSNYAGADNTDIRLVYGISPGNALRAPFNRADYFISFAAAPARCAAGTGTLVKAALNHVDGTLTQMPVLDCVADMQVVYALDNDENGSFQNGVGGDAYANTVTGLTPAQVRTRVRDVEVYILAHEGQRDPNFTFNNFSVAGACGATCVTVGRSAILGRDFNVNAILNGLNYRWKVYTISVATENLR